MTAVAPPVPRPGVACHNGGCSAPASLAIRVGCVHEHIVWTVGCVEHVEGFRAGRSATCWLCSRSAEPHRCAVREVVR